MRILLDTHALLWFGLNDPKLSPTAQSLIADPSNEIEISPASYWEIAIKIQLGKYAIAEGYDSFFTRVIAAYRFQILAIEIRHTALLTSLPLHHRDPFDRLIIAQASVEAIPILSADSIVDQYPVTRLW